jgi:peroxiredoxin
MSAKLPEPATGAEAFEIAADLGGALQSRLDAYSKFSRKLSPAVNEAYDELIARLSGAKHAGPAIGSPMPGFALPDQDSRIRTLHSFLNEGPLVISFNRGHWCPWCRLELRDLARHYEEIRAAGAQAVSIIPETAAYSRRLAESNGLPFPVLTDLDLGYSLSLGLAIWAGAKIRDLYKKTGLDLGLFQNNEGWMLPIPATFLISSDGSVKARFVETDFRRRMDPEEIVAALST